MTRLNQEMRQVLDEIVVARGLYRQGQAMKRDGDVGQEYVNDRLDDYEHLVRYYALLRAETEAAVLQIQFPEWEPPKEIETVRGRIYGRLKSEVKA